MDELKVQIRASMALGILALPAGIMDHPALTDIFHNEVDVTLEGPCCAPAPWS